jgi:membrane protease YdiL (CAAX protease family)
VTQHARELAAAERSVILADAHANESWRTTERSLRVTACPATAGDPHLRVELRPDGAAPFTRPLAAAASDARRCVGARYTFARPASFRVALVAVGAPPPLRRIALFVGPELRPAVTWVWLALALSLALLVLAPSLSGPAVRRPPTLGSLIFRPLVERPAAPVALVAAFVAAQLLPMLVFSALRGSPLAVLYGGATLQLALGLAAAWLLGGLSADGPPLRAALGLERADAVWLGRAPLIALALLLLAALTTAFITDTSESAVAQAVASAPLRLVLLYTALLAPLSEELFYRGALTRALARLGPTGAIVTQAAIFTSLHAMQLQGAYLGLLPIAALGLANGWLRRASGGLAAPWLVHSLYNGALIATTLLAPG